MSGFVLGAVPEIRFGPGRLADIAVKAEALAGRGAVVLVVADPALEAAGITGLARDLLGKAGF